MELTVSVGGDYWEHIITEGARGWRVGEKQKQLYVTRLAKYEEAVAAGKPLHDSDFIIKELKLKLEHWCD